MLDAVWAILSNYGLDVTAIANAMAKLFASNGDGSFGGNLAELADIPVLGDLLKAFASFAPAVTTTVTEVIE